MLPSTVSNNIELSGTECIMHDLFQAVYHAPTSVTLKGSILFIIVTSLLVPSEVPTQIWFSQKYRHIIELYVCIKYSNVFVPKK